MEEGSIKTPKTALKRAKSHDRKKNASGKRDVSIMLEDDLKIPNAMNEDEEDEEIGWLKMDGEKSLPIESMDTFDPFHNDKASAVELQNVRICKKYHMENIRSWRFTNDTESHPYREYPDSWDGDCNRCGRYIGKQPPVFPPEYLDPKKKTWVLEIFAHCVICRYTHLYKSRIHAL